jgi:hypothetical protein
MNIVLTVIVGYIGLGVVSLVLLEAITHRITKKLDNAALDTVDKLSASGNIVTVKSAKVLLLMAIFAFWPATIYGALTKEKVRSTEVSPLKQRINKLLDYDLRKIIPGKKGDDNDGKES